MTSGERKGFQPWKNFLAGGVGGAWMVIVGYPLDTVKVRLQTQPSSLSGDKPLFGGAWDCFFKTFRNEGIRGLYKGMVAPLTVVTPVCAIAFFGYEAGKRLQQKSYHDKLTSLQHFNAGVISSVMTFLINTPAERVKCVMQVQMASGEKPRYSSSLDCARQLYREGGIRNVYKGTVATFWRDTPATGAFFVTYEFILESLTPTGRSRDELSPARILLAGGSAGMAYWVVCIAPDTLKSRLQASPPGKYSGVSQVFMDMVRTEGLGSLFKGLSPVLVRAFPVSAVCFYGFEVTMRFLNLIVPNL